MTKVCELSVQSLAVSYEVPGQDRCGPVTLKSVLQNVSVQLRSGQLVALMGK
jgi:hypothetical protein